MGKGYYFAKHTGKQLDDAITAISRAGLDNLLHDRGYYKAASGLPTDAKVGDFAFVGTFTNAKIYTYNTSTGWTDSGNTFDLSTRSAVTLTQDEGFNTNLVMSQKAVTERIQAAEKEAEDRLTFEIGEVQGEIELINEGLFDLSTDLQTEVSRSKFEDAHHDYEIDALKSRDVVLTAEQYEALPVKDPDKYYYTYEE